MALSVAQFRMANFASWPASAIGPARAAPDANSVIGDYFFCLT
jgi:hypothetical protein